MADAEAPLRAASGGHRFAIGADVFVEAMQCWTHPWIDQVNAALAWQEALAAPEGLACGAQPASRAMP